MKEWAKIFKDFDSPTFSKVYLSTKILFPNISDNQIELLINALILWDAKYNVLFLHGSLHGDPSRQIPLLRQTMCLV